MTPSNLGHRTRSALAEAPVHTEQHEDWPEWDEMRHLYPSITGHRPVPGAIAWCGYRKRSPTRFPSNAAAAGSGLPLCSTCQAITSGHKNEPGA